MANSRQHFAVNLVVCLLLGGAGWATFSRVVNAPFFYDDRSSYVENETIRQLWPLSGPLAPPREHPFSARPLVNLSAAVNYHFGGLDPAGYRLVNMALQLLSALLLYGIVGRTLRLDYFHSWLPMGDARHWITTALAFAVALVWTVHPLQTETVCYVTQRTELMVGLFYLATLYASIRYWLANGSASKAAWLVLAVLACALGMASKEVMVSAPLVVLLYQWTFLTSGNDAGKQLRATWPLYVGLCLTWILLVYLIADAPRSKSAGFGLGVSMITYWETQAGVIWMYLKLAFWPWPLSIHHHVPLVESMGEVLGSLVVIAALGAGTLVALWHRWAVGFLGAWFFIILSPTSLVPIISEVAAERRMYLPLAAIVALVIVGGYWLVLRVARRRQAAAVGMLLAAAGLSAVLAAVSHHRLAAYQTEVSIWQDALAQYPESEVVHLCLALALSHAEQHGEAAEHFATAIRLEPMNLYHRVRYAEALRAAGKPTEAIAQLEEVVLRMPGYAQAQYELGVLLHETGRTQDAARHLAEAVKLRPKDPRYRTEYGQSLRALGQYRAAAAQFEQAVQLQPDDVRSRESLARALIQLGKAKQAAVQLATALKLEPANAELRTLYGEALRLAGQYPEAISQFRQAMELNPKLRGPYVGLAQTYTAMGSHGEAVDQYERLLKRHPDDASTHEALGTLWMEAGNYEEAVRYYERAAELEPNAAEYRGQLGISLLEVGHTNEAVTHLEEGARMAPDSALGQFQLAEAYAAGGRRADAQSAARRALELARAQQDTAMVEKVESWLADHEMSE